MTALLSALALVAPSTVRPPMVPLVTFDRFLSVWSGADRLTDDTTRHWTKREHPLQSLVRIDGKAYRLMGKMPADVPALPQVGLRVLPTRSIYEFENESVHVTLTFTTAVLPADLDALSRPLSYLTWEVRATDGRMHDVAIYDGVSGRLAVNQPGETVEARREAMGSVTALRIGKADQRLLSVSGDDARVDWGYAYLAASTAQAKAAIGGDGTLLASFVSTGALPGTDDLRARAANDDDPTLAVAFDLGRVGEKAVARHATVAYDEIAAIRFFGEPLKPYWRRNGATPSSMLQAAEKDYARLSAACATFDSALMADMTKAGGAKYAEMAALSYRQSFAANGLAADRNGQPLFFTKENTSNGDIATVDVIFPMDPLWVFLSPTLAKASLAPVFQYAASGRWRWPCAPHDLGTYPIARGTDDGGEAMPVEESGNMIILADAIAKDDGNADFASQWWPQLTQWTQFLEQYGLDPGDQLCTDDFMGHLAHNANLSVKAIVALAAYGDLCRMRGDMANAKKYTDLARADAAHWVQVADAGDHSLLAFDKPGTWSQKYNLVWDKLLGLNVFPPEVARKEIAYYGKVKERYGVPLDSRTKLTKSDWTVWSATMAEDRADFIALTAPMYDYVGGTTARSPFPDSYVTTNVRSDGMHARPVIGGVFIKMLDDRAVWKKWASMDKMRPKGWASLPPKPIVTPIVPNSQAGTPAIWKYTTERPSDDWAKAGFDDSAWKSGPAGFGNQGAHHTDWGTSDIWIRRTLTLPEFTAQNLQFYVWHDEDVEIYVDGLLASTETDFTTSYVPLDIAPAAKARLRPGATVTIAAHCHQTVGGQGIDIGLANVKSP